MHLGASSHILNGFPCSRPNIVIIIVIIVVVVVVVVVVVWLSVSLSLVLSLLLLFFAFDCVRQSHNSNSIVRLN